MRKLTYIILFLFLITGIFPQEDSRFVMTIQVQPLAPSTVIFSKSSKLFAVVTSNGVAIWNINGRLERFIEMNQAIIDFEFSDDDSYAGYSFYGSYGSSIEVIHIKSGKKMIMQNSDKKIQLRNFFALNFTHDNKLITSALVSLRIVIPHRLPVEEFEKLLDKANLEQRSLLLNYYLYNENNNAYYLDTNITYNRDYIELKLFMENDYPGGFDYSLSEEKLELWELNGSLIKVIGVNEASEKYGTIRHIVPGPDNDLFTVGTEKGNIAMWSINNGFMNDLLQTTRILSIKHNKAGNLIGVLSSSNVFHIINLNGIILKTFKKAITDFDLDNEELLDISISGSESSSIILTDYSGNKKFETESLKLYPRYGFTILSPDHKYILSTLSDNSINIFSLKTGKQVVFINKNSEWLTYIKSGYWDASPGGGKLISMVQGYEAYGVDNFAVKYNRPDIILKWLGSEDEDLIDHYYFQYLKRLRRMKLDRDNVESDIELHVPEAKITNELVKNKEAELSIKLFDTKYSLKSYNIYINDVPVYNGAGKSIDAKEIQLKDTIELSYGKNKVEVSCFNENGAESYRALTYLNYKKKVERNLYFIAFGISEYKSNEITDLGYAHKDALDLEKLFKDYQGYFKNVYTAVYTNKQVNKNNIRDSIKLLKNASVDDVLVLFIAGHGMHDMDQDSTYYFITYDTDLSNLKNTAADFDIFENLLQQAVPRTKLFFMDTCESGELDVEDIYFADNQNIGSRSLRARSLNGLKKIKTTKSKAVKRIYLFEKDRFIYNDLLRRTGTIVFSSSKGGEFSYEFDEIENGIFTEQIINAIKGKKADDDHNGVVTMEELKKYVSISVAEYSNNLQHPTVDKDNIYIEFALPVTNK